MYEGKLYFSATPVWSAYPGRTALYYRELARAYEVGLVGQGGQRQLPPDIPVLSDYEMHRRRDAGDGQILRVRTVTLVYDVDAPSRLHPELDRHNWAYFVPLRPFDTHEKYLGGPGTFDEDLRFVLGCIREELAKQPHVLGVTLPSLVWSLDLPPRFCATVYVNVLVGSDSKSE
jgi:hypothetical protein